MATRTEISRKCRYRGKNNEYGTVYYIREFFTQNFRSTVVWSVNRIELSGAGRKKGDIEIVVNGETVILSLKESQGGFKTQYKYLDEAEKDGIKAVGMRGHGEKYQRTVMAMYLDEYLKMRFKDYFKNSEGSRGID